MSIAIKFKNDSYLGALAITPSDTVDFANPVSAVYVGVAGHITAVMASGEVALFSNVAVGVFPIACSRINATGTTATTMIGLK